MTEPLPATGDVPAAKLCDARDLVLAHLTFRRLYALSPEAVRHADPADKSRVASIATNVTRVTTHSTITIGSRMRISGISLRVANPRARSTSRR